MNKKIVRQQEQEYVLEEARKAYRSVAKNAMESKSLRPDSESRLIKSIKKTSQEFVHDTGKIRIEDVDGIGPNISKKLAMIGIFSPDDLYHEFKEGHLEEILALQKIDSGFNTEVMAKTISASTNMPEEGFGTGIIDLTLLDGTHVKTPVSKIFDIFKKQVRGQDLNNEEENIKNALRDKEHRLKERFRNSNSVEGVQLVLEEAEQKLGKIDLRPFMFKDKTSISGRRVDEIKKYFEKIGFVEESPKYITLQERGAYLTQSIKEGLCQSMEDPEECKVVTTGLREIFPTGRELHLKNTITKLVKKDLRSNPENTPEKILSRGKRTFSTLNADKNEIAKLMADLIKEDKLAGGNIVGGIPTSNVYPTKKELMKDITKPQSIVVGKTVNPRITDHLDFIHRLEEETIEEYYNRLMDKAGNAVYEQSSIVPTRFTLKIPTRHKTFEEDMKKAVEILGVNTKTGFVPLGYDYKDVGMAERFNTFNVMIKPSFYTTNRFHKPIVFINAQDKLIFAFEANTQRPMVPNIGLTNILKSKGDDKYITSICPFSTNVMINREEALARSLLSSADIVQEIVPLVKNNRITRPKMGSITGMYFLAKTLKPELITTSEQDIRSGITPIWKINTLTSDIQSVLSDEELIELTPKVRDKLEQRKIGKRPKMSHQESKLGALLGLNDRYGPILNKALEARRNATNMRAERRRKESGAYNRKRRIGCTNVAQDKIEDKILVEIPRKFLKLVKGEEVEEDSQAYKDIVSALSDVCPDMEEKCVLEQIEFHQNITDNVGMALFPDNIISRTVKRLNKISPTKVTLDKVVKMVQNKAFGSGKTFTGGQKEIERVFGEVQSKGNRTLDLGKWGFLDKLTQFTV